MDISILQQFLQLSQSQRMTETADLFSISQSTLSKNISRLEEELGVKLFDRVGRHIELNHNGKMYAGYISRALEQMEHGRQHLRREQYEMTGQITILYRSFAPILSDCIYQYTRLNPNVEFTLCEGETRAENPDFILRSYSPDSSSNTRNQAWIMEELFQEQIWFAVSPHCPFLKGKKPEILLDLREVPFVSDLMHDLFFRDITVKLCQKAGFTPRIPYRSDKYLAKVDLLKNGMCAACMPESNLEIARKIAGELFLVGERDDPEWHRSVAILHKKEAQMTETAADFLDFLLDYFKVKSASSASVV